MAYDDDDDLDDDDDDDIDDDLDDDDEDDVYPCPECGNLVYGDAGACPSCGYFYEHHQPWYYGQRKTVASYLNAKPLIIAVIVMLVCIWFLASIPF